MTPEQELDRANRARRIVESELYREAFEAVENRMIQLFIDSPIKGGDDDRRHARIALEVIKSVKASLESHMTTGKLVELDLVKKRGLFR